MRKLLLQMASKMQFLFIQMTTTNSYFQNNREYKFGVLRISHLRQSIQKMRTAFLWVITQQAVVIPSTWRRKTEITIQKSQSFAHTKLIPDRFPLVTYHNPAHPKFLQSVPSNGSSDSCNSLTHL